MSLSFAVRHSTSPETAPNPASLTPTRATPVPPGSPWPLAALEGLQARLAAPHSALLLIDVDGMALLNLALGRSAGDAILDTLYARLRILGCGTVPPARAGGDRFAMALTATSRDEADEAALAVLRVLQNPIDLPNHGNVTVNVSLGLARGPGTLLDLLTAAQSALTEAKSRGGRSWQVAPLVHG